MREVPPFATRTAAGSWEGLSIDLWRAVAAEAGLAFEFREASLRETLDGLQAGTLDVGLSALSVTAERERALDFTHPYLVSGLTLARPPDGGGAWAATLAGVLSPEFLGAVGTLALVLLVSGVLVWLAERRANPEQFGHGSLLEGIATGFWWSAVTMTTVGYGDKAPKTFLGRAIALVWMFVSLVIVASLTASIAASLTTNSLREALERDRPLDQILIGVVADSAAADFAATHGARTRSYPDVGAALAGLRAGDTEAVLHDRPILRHQVRTAFDDLRVDRERLGRDDYAFALPPGSPLREVVNQRLIAALRTPAWTETRARWLGATGAE